ncbi:DNA polymerase delta subunit 3-like [Nicotiana sylvestris]|uniref:DNA polymerase delta subunit 3-like n=1 Tax=Nicotiana sylvestris TaxID=4096 RepID=UPI00388C8E47
MLARKTVASGALRKVLNEKLKARQRKESPTQESNSSSESEAFISASEGEEHGSSDTAKIQETPGEVSSCVVLSIVVENVENRFVLVGPVKDVKGAESSRSGGGNKSGGSGSGEAAERLVHLSNQQDEPGSSIEETLANLLKRVGASYDPKKLPKGRATRSRVRQSEAELQKALEENKKKMKEKGKTKVVESSEVAEEEEEEMELVHQERGTTVEVPTPKPKRAKASSKKSSSEHVFAEPSLAKRTRSAVKGKQKKFLKGRLLRDLDEPRMRRLVDALVVQGWKDMVLEMDRRLARK